MAASYPGLLAGGITDLGRFDQFDLYAGEGDIVTDQGQAADGQAILQFQVIARDADGRIVPWAGTGEYATGTITFNAQPSAADTVSVNGADITFVSSAPGATDVLIGTTTADTAAALADVINSDPDTYAVTATANGIVVTVAAIEAGSGGNAIALAASGTNPDVSGATLTDASDTSEPVPSDKPIGIAAQPVDATTPGTSLPYFTGGVFNHEALVWPAGLNTLADRKRAFDGTNIGVRQLL